jgi:uncharacterized protein (TIGR03437 family)
MTHRIYSTFAVALALAFPVAALADVQGTPTISSGSDYSFDTGTASSSGGDVKFTGTSITFVGSATGYDLGNGGATTYGALSDSTISSFGSAPGLLSQAAITGGSLAANEVFVVKTNGGNYAKVLIVSVSGSSLKIQYNAVGSTVTGGTATPGITAVLDAGSYTASIVPGSVFVVKGNNMSAAGPVVEPGFPLPTSSNGVSITFTPPFGGTAVQAYIVYLYNQGGVNQLAAILPSTVSPGTYNVTVTNGGSTSSAFSVQVVATKPGLITADSTGNGLVVAQNYISASELDVNRFTTGSFGGFTISPAHPGQTLIIYLTGMGAVSGGDNTASAGYDFTQHGVTVQVFVGGMAITPFYAGRTPGSAGLDQIDVTLPNNVPTGCTEEFHIVENGNLSQSTFLSVAPAGAAACVQPGFTTSQLQNFDTGTITYSGGFTLGTFSGVEPGFGNVTTYSGSGGFTKFTGFELAGIPPSSTANLPTGCVVTQIMPYQGSTTATGVGSALDAGAVTLSGPGGSNLSSTPFIETSDVYTLSIGEQGLPSIAAGSYGNGVIVAGNYTLKGAGGQDVGAFTGNVTLGAPFNVTGGVPTVVNRSAGLTLNWTGGNSSDLVLISGEAAIGTNPNQTGAAFICYTTAGKGTYTVTSSTLNQLPAVTAAQNSAQTGVGYLSVLVITAPGGSFNAPLTAGGTISNAGFTATTTLAGTAAYQ